MLWNHGTAASSLPSSLPARANNLLLNASMLLQGIQAVEFASGRLKPHN